MIQVFNDKVNIIAIKRILICELNYQPGKHREISFILKIIILKVETNFYLQSELTIYVESVCAHTKAHIVLTYNDVHANDGLPCIQEDFNALRTWRFFARQLRCNYSLLLSHIHISKVSFKFKRDKLFKFRCCLRTEGF